MWQNALKKEGDPQAWRHMVPIKRYKHHTLFAKRTFKGDVYYESFLNIDVDRGKKRG